MIAERAAAVSYSIFKYLVRSIRAARRITSVFLFSRVKACHNFKIHNNLSRASGSRPVRITPPLEYLST